MIRYILPLILLAGCAGVAHRHPHDHGLSAIKGNMRILATSDERLFKRILGVTFQIDEVRSKNTSLELRLKDAETQLLKQDILYKSVDRLDKQLVALEKQISLNNADIAEALIQLETKSNKELFRHLTDVSNLEGAIMRVMESNRRSLVDIREEIQKLKPQQRLIELRPEPEEKNEEKK